MSSAVTWGATIRLLRDGPRRAEWVENLRTDVKIKESYILPTAKISTLLLCKRFHLKPRRCLLMKIHILWYHTEQRRYTRLDNIPETRASWETSASLFLTCSCCWPGIGSSFSLDTASALCSSWLGGMSTS